MSSKAEVQPRSGSSSVDPPGEPTEGAGRDADTTLCVDEYETAPGITLSPAQVRELRRLSPMLDVRPSLDRGFDLTATSWIGNVRAAGLSLTIRPKVSIERVLFLLSYSLDPSAWRDTEFDYASDDQLLEAMAPGFAALTRRGLSRGLIRGYRQRESALQTVRGQLRFGDQIRQRFGRFPPAEVTWDEFTQDVPENRILLAAVERLGRLPLRSKAVVRDLRRLRGRFQGVAVVDYSRRKIPKVHFTRLNEHYRPALRLARLILENSSIRQRSGGVTSSSLLVNMNSVFENFVVVALREALGLSERVFPQEMRGRRLWLDRGRDVRLEPDFSWWRGGVPVFVGDVKYKDLDRGGVRNPDVYQVLAYLEGSGLDTGMLVYPSRRNEARRVEIQGSGKTILVRGWALDRAPEELLERVKEVARQIRRGIVQADSSLQ